MAFHRKAGAWLVDYGYMVRGVVAMAIHRDPPKHYRGYTVAGKVPVVLIPGIMEKWGFMKHLGDAISLAGHPTYIIPELDYNLRSIASSAKALRSLVVRLIPSRKHLPARVMRRAQTIKQFLEKEHLSGVVLVAHSKGGLVGKYVLTHHNSDNRVLGMVAVATPFSGSALAKLIPHHAFKEMHTDSDIIADLGGRSEANGRIISIIPEFDNHVWAEQGCFLEGAAENIEVLVHGHHKVLFDTNVLATILSAIEKLLNTRL